MTKKSFGHNIPVCLIRSASGRYIFENYKKQKIRNLKQITLKKTLKRSKTKIGMSI